MENTQTELLQTQIRVHDYGDTLKAYAELGALIGEWMTAIGPNRIIYNIVTGHDGAESFVATIFYEGEVGF